MFLRSAARKLKAGSGTSSVQQAVIMSFSDSSQSVNHDQKNQVFYIDLQEPDSKDSKDRAVLQYQWVRKGLVDLYHTGVPPAYRGQGIAQLLAKSAFDYVVKADAKMRLSCTYLQKYFQDNPLPEYQDRVVPLE